MCPEKSLLSAYYDGEVPSPYKEKIEKHLNSCKICKQLVSGFGEISSLLQKDLEPVIDIQKAFDNIQEKTRSSKIRLWKKDIHLPFPVAAAAAVFVLILSGRSFLAGFFQGDELAVNEQIRTEMPIEVSYEEVDNLLQDLEKEDSGRSENEINDIIVLPPAKSLRPMGDPTFLRSTSFSGGKP